MNTQRSALAILKLVIAAALAVFAVVELVAAVQFARVALAGLGAFCILGAIFLLPSAWRKGPRTIGLTGLVFASAIATAVPLSLTDDNFPKHCSGNSRVLCYLLNYIHEQGGSIAVSTMWALFAFVVALASYLVITHGRA